MRQRLLALSLQAFAILLAVANLATGQPASGALVSTLHSFGSGSPKGDGLSPLSGLIQGSDGSFYGTSYLGGSAGNGSVYKIASSGTVVILHSFADGSVTNDGTYPQAALLQGADGNFYGTTKVGGTKGLGTLFKMTAAGGMTILHSFGDGSVTNDGTTPEASLVQGADGSIYGTTYLGGSAGQGTVFKAAISGSVTILHSFGDGSVANDGANPASGLVLASDGNLYGTTVYGGASVGHGSAGGGTIFRISTAGTAVLIHSFGDGLVAHDGIAPYASLIQASDGNLYGTTNQGGAAGEGVVFKVSLLGSMSILHSFGDGSVANDGAYPYAGLTETNDFDFRGTTEYGGSTDDADGVAGSGMGTIFKITMTGALTVLHSFGDGSVSDDGTYPWAGVIQASDGSCYGTTSSGGSANYGTVYKLVLSTSRFDFNGDGMDDLLWQNSQTGQLVVWNMNGLAVSPGSLGNIFATVNPVWKIKAVADINGDNHPDLLWWNSKTGQLIFWEMTGSWGTTQLYASPVVYTVSNTQWQPVSMIDLDGDGHPDILWENMTTGQLIVWYMNGTSQKSASGVFATLPANWRVAGMADFDGDGHPDLVLENFITGQVEIWYLTGAGGTLIKLQGLVFATVSNTAWQIVSTGDMNGDGHPDLTWHNAVTGQTIVWLMGGTIGTTLLKAGSALSASPKTTWSIVGVR